jgi:hypothetical protein
MPTHAELSAKLLVDAAGFFKNLGDSNLALKKQMDENADVFEQMAQLISAAPEGKIDDKTHGQLAGRLLQDAAVFFRTIGEQNEPIREQMMQNADAYEQVGTLVSQDPLGILD